METPVKEFKFEIKCEADKINPLLKSIFSEIKKEIDYSEEFEFKFELAAREILANAIEHGCCLANSGGKKLLIKTVTKISSENIIFSVQDPGPGFEWEKYDLEKMPKFEEKGRGLKMINRVTDNMEFNKSGNKVTVFFEI